MGLNGILGSWDGRDWVAWTSGDPAPSRGAYEVVGLFGSPETVTGNPVVTGCGGSERPTVDVGLDPAGDMSMAGVAVAGAGVRAAAAGRGPRSRRPRSTARPRSRSPPLVGVAEPQARVTQVVRADLDGDGTAEVLVTADQLSDPSSSLARPGDWSVVFMRRVVDGEVRTVLSRPT